MPDAFLVLYQATVVIFRMAMLIDGNAKVFDDYLVIADAVAYVPRESHHTFADQNGVFQACLCRPLVTLLTCKFVYCIGCIHIFGCEMKPACNYIFSVALTVFFAL